ncbi:hypothetical protein [Maribacter sp. 2304DJ31-5]|uniref:hypothetical protein n=1 Tax=Maribacter sp. 2304DJ31-5 TaxID=3386273 RepID=UPI0039BC637B
MGRKKRIGKNIAALLLFVAIMMPTAIRFFHIFEGHEHVSCKEVSTHIHQDVPDCHICDYHMASFNYHIIEYPNLLQPTIPVKINEDFSSLLFHSFKITNTQLRAPPIFS